MPLQPDLLGSQPLSVTPAAGVTGPRLWVRRLVIWKEPGGEKVRDISLAPGLNIIWSPDGADDVAAGGQTNALGHGSGKTLFCRLIRYCLGEDRFSTEAQRDRIGTALLNGLVGAEVMLDGICWAIVRPLGVRRRHMAVSNGNLEEIAAGEGSSTGLEPFIQAVEQSIITPGLADLIRPGTGGAVWPVALAWLTRDQECRFDDVLDWRSPASDSDSPLPASGREKGPRLEALRAFLMAITPEEQAARTQVIALDEQRRLLDQEIGHRRWEIDRAQIRLVPALGLTDQTLPDMPLLIDVLRKTANERVTAATKLPAGGNAELLAARKEFETARSEWIRLDGERIRIEASIPVEERLLSQIQGELPGLSFSKVEADSPVCPICEVPIDRALAEGCKLSHKIPDAAACQQRWAQRQTDFQEQGKRLRDLRQERTQILQQVALAKQKFEQLRDRVIAIEKARDSRETAWYSARRLQDDVERLSDLVDAQVEGPASRNGIALMLPTKGVIEGGGITSTNAGDRSGIHCKTIKDDALVLDSIKGFQSRDMYTAIPKGIIPDKPYTTFLVPDSEVKDKPLKGVRVAIVREFMVKHTKNDAAISDQMDAEIKSVLRDKLGATLVESVDPLYPDDPTVPNMTYSFQDAMAEVLPHTVPEFFFKKKPNGDLLFAVPGWDVTSIDYDVALELHKAPLSNEINIRSIAGMGYANPSTLLDTNEYLAARGDARVKDWASWVANGNFKTDQERAQAENALAIKDPRPAPGPVDYLAMQAAMRMILLKVMHENNIDVFVNPEITTPPYLLGGAPEPEVLSRASASCCQILTALLGAPEADVPAGFVTTVYNPKYVLSEDKKQYTPVTGDVESKLPHPMPISLMVWSGPGYDSDVIKVASAYEAATHHRTPPPAFGPVSGEK